MPTGGGKTLIAADITERALSKNKRVLITVPALSLIDQTLDRFYHQGIRDVGVIQSNHMQTNAGRPVQIASVQTLQRRLMPETDLVIVDECHVIFKKFEQWMNIDWAGVPVIGLSATPWSKGLGAYFGDLIIANTIPQMIEQKALVPFRVFAPSHPDLKGVRTSMGDYVVSDLHEKMSKSKIVADVVETWKALGEGRPTVCFAVNRAHADQISKEFEAAGVPAGYMDCDTSQSERDAIKGRLMSGRIKVVCNVDVIGLGVDWPEISCIIYARPTKSEMRYVQNIGRGLRTADGKQDLIIIDHSDTTMRLGFVSDIHHELDDGKPKATAEKAIMLPKECMKCHFLKPPRMAKCPQCGFVMEAHAKPIVAAAGTLMELNGDAFMASPVAKKLAGKAETYGQLMWYAQSKGYKKGWADNKYRSIYGVWPRMLDWQPHQKAPSMELASWIKSQNIRWAKSRRVAIGNPRINGHTEFDAPVAGHATDNGFVAGTLCTQDDLENFR